MRCTLQISDSDSLFKILSLENFGSDRAKCKISKGLVEIEAKDPASMRSIVNSVLKVIEAHDKAMQIK